MSFRYYNSIIKLKFQHKQKYHLSKILVKNKLITQGPKSLKLLYSIMKLNTISFLVSKANKGSFQYLLICYTKRRQQQQCAYSSLVDYLRFFDVINLQWDFCFCFFLKVWSPCTSFHTPILKYFDFIMNLNSWINLKSNIVMNLFFYKKLLYFSFDTHTIIDFHSITNLNS